MVARLDRLISESIIIILVLALEYYSLRPLIGDGVGYILIGLTFIILLLDVLRNVL